jgi:hypothetical protein
LNASKSLQHIPASEALTVIPHRKAPDFTFKHGSKMNARCFVGSSVLDRVADRRPSPPPDNRQPAARSSQVFLLIELKPLNQFFCLLGWGVIPNRDNLPCT